MSNTNSNVQLTEIEEERKKQIEIERESSLKDYKTCKINFFINLLSWFFIFVLGSKIAEEYDDKSVGVVGEGLDLILEVPEPNMKIVRLWDQLEKIINPSFTNSITLKVSRDVRKSKATKIFKITKGLVSKILWIESQNPSLYFEGRIFEKLVMGLMNKNTNLIFISNFWMRKKIFQKLFYIFLVNSFKNVLSYCSLRYKKQHFLI